MGRIEKIKCDGCGTLNDPKLENCQKCGLTLKFVKNNGLIVGVSREELDNYNEQLKKIKKEQQDEVKFEKTKPEYYEVQSSFETEEEYRQRHLAYGYVEIGEFELNEEDYDIGNKRFKIITKIIMSTLVLRMNEDENSFYCYIKIEADDAKKLFKERTNRNIYEKYVNTGKGFENILYIIVNNKAYVVKTTEADIRKTRKIKRDKDIKIREKKMFIYNFIILFGILFSIIGFFTFPGPMLLIIIVSSAFLVWGLHLADNDEK